MKVTITDVAKRAGVSMKTVSRVLNKEPNVAQKTRDRVMQVAKELRYSPNLAARGLASSKSYLIALMYDNPSPNYIARVQRGAIDACRAKGYHLVIEPLSFNPAFDSLEQEQEFSLILDRLPVDGVILTPPLSDSSLIMETLDRLNIRYVRIAPDVSIEGVAEVKMDDTQAAREMTDLLVGMGHKRIGFIRGHVDHSATPLRFAGYREALINNGLDLLDDLVVQGDFSFRSGVSGAEKLLANATDRPTAIFASNDDMAAGVVSVAGRMGISVPDELSVCGFDDTPLAKILWPQLTTVQQPIYQMGRRAAEFLTTPEGASSQQSVIDLDFELIIRESTKAIRS